MLERVPQRGRRVDRRKDFAARGFDVGLEPFDAAMRRLIGVRFGCNRRRRAIALQPRFDGRGAPCRERRTRRFAPRIEQFELSGHRRRAILHRLNLLAVERNLLLLAVDGQLAGMRRLASRRRARLGLDELDPHAPEGRFDLGDAG